MPAARRKNQDEIKQAVGYKAAELVEDGMLVGLGTGSTATYFIERLIALTQKGLSITAVATSERSKSQAEAGGIRMVDMEEVTEIDLTVDGADEIDGQKRMIKGGGGALLREKIIAVTSREMVVVIDEGKRVEALGAFPLPVEIVRFGAASTLKRLEAQGFTGGIRKGSDGTFFITDEGHYIVDIPFGQPIDSPEAAHQTILATPGVVETGFFFDVAGRVIVGYEDGRVEIVE